jgi:hypothetical protein
MTSKVSKIPVPPKISQNTAENSLEKAIKKMIWKNSSEKYEPFHFIPILIPKKLCPPHKGIAS